MTDKQMTLEAEQIRQRWTAPPAPEPTDRSPLEAYVAKVNETRPLGPGDTGMLQALGAYGTSSINRTRDQQVERKSIIQHLKHPDLTGLGGGPDSAALQRHPDLLALWNGRAHEDPAVQEQTLRQIEEQRNPKPYSDPKLTAALKRFAASRFKPKRAPRS